MPPRGAGKHTIGTNAVPVPAVKGKGRAPGGAKQGYQGGADEDAVPVCPLCIKQLDNDELEFDPCPCGYKVCVFCYKRLLDEFDKKCPNCRIPYGSDQSAYEKRGAMEAGAAVRNPDARASLPRNTQFVDPDHDETAADATNNKPADNGAVSIAHQRSSSWGTIPNGVISPAHQLDLAAHNPEEWPSLAGWGSANHAFERATTVRPSDDAHVAAAAALCPSAQPATHASHSGRVVARHVSADLVTDAHQQHRQQDASFGRVASPASEAQAAGEPVDLTQAVLRYRVDNSRYCLFEVPTQHYLCKRADVAPSAQARDAAQRLQQSVAHGSMNAHEAATRIMQQFVPPSRLDPLDDLRRRFAVLTRLPNGVVSSTSQHWGDAPSTSGVGMPSGARASSDSNMAGHHRAAVKAPPGFGPRNGYQLQQLDLVADQAPAVSPFML